MCERELQINGCIDTLERVGKEKRHAVVVVDDGEVWKGETGESEQQADSLVMTASKVGHGEMQGYHAPD